MNECKICVSVIANTGNEMVALMRRAEPLADVIELRCDRLPMEEFRDLFENLTSEKQLLLTLRPKREGGESAADLQERIGFWMQYALHQSVDHGSVWIDHEHDLIPEKEFMFWVDKCFVIRSKHYLEGVNADLDKAYSTVTAANEVGKLAVFVNDAVDALSIWKVLEKANAEGKRFIPIAMGEAGKWTRVLGPAYGAFMTYASLESGSETAPGQISASDLIDTFRVREITPQHSVYGLIAAATDYSVSPWMHNAAFKTADIPSVFVPFQTSDVEKFVRQMVLPAIREVDLNFGGFSVTNPHKGSILAFMDELDPSAERIGAVNTVKVEEDKLKGFNTDAFGFISTLKDAYGSVEGTRVAVFGAGGAARACIVGLLDEGAQVGLFARNEEKGKTLAEEFGIAWEHIVGDRRMADEFDIVVNATPLGTQGGRSNFCVLTAAALEGIKLVYDLVYNPSETRLMKEAKEAGVPTIGGMEMLIAQGAKQFEIWTGRNAPVDAMRSAVERRLIPANSE
ncbi:MAG TPA: shikimate dehydrogenase [Pyrinomonadaceae bacterium]|nr:shikimate dehydrogenase [Pyrinomonadaceae bacterium]